MPLPKPTRETLVARFWSRVERSDGCWLWTARRFTSGYGCFYVSRSKAVGAHRFSFEAVNGPIPGRLWVLHRCDNPPCVNPAHLFLGTPKDNSQDAVKKGRWSNPPRNDVRGERNPQVKLTPDIVRAIRTRRDTSDATLAEIAGEFHTSQSNVHAIVTRVNWKHL